MKPEVFLAGHSVFSRAELAAVLRSRGRADATIDSHLKRWRRQGRIARVKPGVFVRLDAGSPASDVEPDFIALASRMAPDAAIAYHTALESHGVAQSVFERLTFVTWTKTKPASYRSRRFVPVRPRASLVTANRGEQWIERADRAGVELRVTTIERTVADVLDRPDLAGGIEEVWRSIGSVPALDPASLEEYVAVLGSATLAARVGFFLDTRRDELVVPAATLERLRALLPRSPVFMDRRLRGRLVAEWALIVPAAMLGDDRGAPA
ncbi:MAG: transcriptional regulator [Acidobacteria bacterium]|nr:transcriptional regulator [Acidobacteriota bacterium]